MITLTGALDHEVSSGERADRATFEQGGYTVGRGVIPPEVVRAIREPLIEALTADGHIDATDDPDRFRWTGSVETISIEDRVVYRETMQPRIDELIQHSGLGSSVIEALWGQRAAMWEYGTVLFTTAPGFPGSNPHRDGWFFGGTEDVNSHVRLWFPLTQLGDNDGALALAVGSHRIPSVVAAGPPRSRSVHRDSDGGVGNLAEEARDLAPQLEGRWRTTRFDLGDALAFHPAMVHGAGPNDGSCLRIALGMCAQDGRIEIPDAAALSFDSRRDLAPVEGLTLALMAGGPSTAQFARTAFYPRGVVGEIWPEPTERVERAVATLTARGLIEVTQPHEVEWHSVVEATAIGQAELSVWLDKVEADTHRGRRLAEAKARVSGWLAGQAW